MECNMTIDASVDVTAAWTQSCVTRRRQRVWHGMQRDNRRTEIRAFCLAMRQFYVFNKPVMCIFRVVLRCKNVTNTSLMCLSSTRPVTYLLHAVCDAKKNATMHPFYVINTNTPWNVPVSHRFMSEIRPKFARFAPQMHVFYVSNVPHNVCLLCRFKSQTYHRKVLKKHP